MVEVEQDEVREVERRQVDNLEMQIKDLRSDLHELLALKVKPRLASLEREAHESRRRLLALQSCRCRRARGVSPDEEVKKVRQELQDLGEALLDRARREMQRQEELVQSRTASERQVELRSSTSLQAVIKQREAVEDMVQKAEALLRREALEMASKQELQELQARLNGLAASGEQAEALRTAAEAELRSDVAKAAGAATGAQQEAKRTAQMCGRLAAGVRGVEETLERKVQWLEDLGNDLKASVAGAVARKLELEAQKLEDSTQERWDEARRQVREMQARSMEELREAMAANKGRRQQEEQVVQELLRGCREKLLKDGQETVEAAGRAVAEARAGLQQQLLDQGQEVRQAREALVREVGGLRRDMEEKVRAELQRHVTTMGQCSASIEARLQDALAAADQRLGQRMEELRAEERSEMRQLASRTEGLCEEQVRQLLWQVEDQTKLAASKTEEGWRLAQALQDRAAGAVHLAEAEGRRVAQEAEATAAELGRAVEASAARLAEETARRGEERAALAAKLAQAEAQRLAQRGEARAEELAVRAEEQVTEVRELARSLVAASQERSDELCRRSEDRASELVRRAEERVAALGRKAEEEGQSCRGLVQEMSRAHLSRVETMQAVVTETMRNMEALQLEYRSTLQHFAVIKDGADVASRAAVQAQEESAATRNLVEHCRRSSEEKLREVKAELDAFIDEQRVFCGFIDTEQRSYQELIRQEVGALSRLVDASLRIDRRPGSPSSIFEVEPMMPPLASPRPQGFPR